MSLTAFVVLLIYLGGLVAAIGYQPIFALFSYLWIFYNDPTTRWWGTDLPDLRYSLTAAVVALLVTLPRPGPPVSWASTTIAKLFICYAVWTWIQTIWAINLDVHITGAILFTKYVALSYIVYKLAADEKSIEWFLWAHIGGCLLFGLEAYSAEVITRLETIGGPGVDDSNLLAAHMITGLVSAGFMFIIKRGYLRWLAFATLPFILNAIILTQSRGGFLALLGAGVAAWYLSPKIYRRVVTISGCLGVALLLVLSNEFFWERISTIFGSEETEVVQETRLQLLAPQFLMFLDHPFGAGHRGNELLSPQYMPAELLSNSGLRAAHNTFMAALVDQGLPGAIILISLYAWGFFSLFRLKRLDRLGLPVSLGVLRASLGASLASLLVSGLFLNLLKTEVQIWLVALTASLVVLCERAVKSASPDRLSAIANAGRPAVRNANA